MGIPDPRVGAAMVNKEVPPIFSYGTCMPSSCTAEDLRVRRRGVRVEGVMGRRGVRVEGVMERAIGKGRRREEERE